MEKQNYEKIFIETKTLQEKQLEEKLLTFANGDKQMEEEMKAMFARIDMYHEVIQAAEGKKEEDWIAEQLREIVSEINQKDDRHLSVEDFENILKKSIESIKAKNLTKEELERAIKEECEKINQ